jgi:hypothetical protein
VVSHDQKLLDRVPNRKFLKKILLSNIEIDEKYRGENLAENRYLIGNDFVEGDFDYFGFVSARWQERFPNWPQLDDLENEFASLNAPSPTDYFAPTSLRLNKLQLKSWLRAQNVVHPGMTDLLLELVRVNSIVVDRKQTYNLVMGNNFILPKQVASDFLKFWQESFHYLVEKYGLDFPFSYRCPLCGKENPLGIDRWARVRHAGFLMERVSALFFISRPELTPVIFTPTGVSPTKKLAFFRGLGIGGRLLALGTKFLRFGGTCKGNHESKSDARKR